MIQDTVAELFQDESEEDRVGGGGGGQSPTPPSQYASQPTEKNAGPFMFFKCNII